MIEQTGQIRIIGRENVFEATEVVGASIVEAYHVAEKWMEEHEEPEPAADEELDD
ncbi:MAG: hypothetical protein WA996_06695 [Candidatus Promineifilaceae bacterium]